MKFTVVRSTKENNAARPDLLACDTGAHALARRVFEPLALELHNVRGVRRREVGGGGGGEGMKYLITLKNFLMFFSL